MATMSDIEHILEQKLIKFEQVSASMFMFSLLVEPNNHIGSLSITENNQILCRFYYKTPQLSYVNTFIYNAVLFDEEIDRANKNFANMKNKYVNDILDSI